MSAEIVNLRRARRRRNREVDAEAADRNRIMHGRTTSERREAEIERQRADAVLDGARRDQDS